MFFAPFCPNDVRSLVSFARLHIMNSDAPLGAAMSAVVITINPAFIDIYEVCNTICHDYVQQQGRSWDSMPQLLGGKYRGSVIRIAGTIV